jgi:hypothetical protein
MDLQRRFVFTGHAAAFGGRIVRPVDVVLEAGGASALPVTGGRSRWESKRVRFGNFFRIGSASTFAEGVFDSVKQAVDVTNKRIKEETLTSTTTVSAEVRELLVGEHSPSLSVKRVRGTLIAKNPGASGEPPIRPGSDTLIEGVSIDGYKLTVELNTRLFQQQDTYSKVLVASGDPKFVRRQGRALLMAPPATRRAAVSSRLVQSDGTIYGSIVKSVTWANKPYPGAVIDQHTVKVPELGRIFFGELLIARSARRLTMIRLDLGSHTGGWGGIIDIGANGTWSP